MGLADSCCIARLALRYKREGLRFVEFNVDLGPADCCCLLCPTCSSGFVGEAAVCALPPGDLIGKIVVAAAGTSFFSALS